MKKTTEEFVSAQEIAEILGISYDRSLLLVKNNIPHVKVGRKYLVRKFKFRQWYKRQENTKLHEQSYQEDN